MAYKRITPVQALFNNENKLVVIDEDGIVWIETNNRSDWERYCLLPDVPINDDGNRKDF